MVFKIVKIIALALISYFGNQYILKMFVPTLKGKMLDKISMMLVVPIVLCYIMCNGIIREGFEDSELNTATGATKKVAELQQEENQMSQEELAELEQDIQTKLAEVMAAELPKTEESERNDLGHNIPSSESAEQKTEISDQKTSIDLDLLAAEHQKAVETSGAPISDINQGVEPNENGVIPGSKEDVQSKYILLPMDEWLKPELRPAGCFTPSVETWNENVLAY